MTTPLWKATYRGYGECLEATVPAGASLALEVVHATGPLPLAVTVEYGNAAGKLFTESATIPAGAPAGEQVNLLATGAANIVSVKAASGWPGAQVLLVAVAAPPAPAPAPPEPVVTPPVPVPPDAAPPSKSSKAPADKAPAPEVAE